MAKFGSVRVGNQPKRPKGKGGGQEMLPSRHAMSQLVGGDPLSRTMNNYAKLTPTGAEAPSAPAIPSEAEMGTTIT